LRQIFFFAFKYLDNENKRVGFFSNLLGNHNLSRDITQTAKHLKTQITTIDSHSEKAMNQLLNYIVEVIGTVRRLRLEHAKENHNGRDSEVSEVWDDSFAYKAPYKNGSFEKNIIAALEAMNSKLLGFPIQKTINKIIEDIRDYKPEAVRHHSKSYKS
jgi:hypothetical protein